MASYLLICDECGIIDTAPTQSSLELVRDGHPHDCQITLDYRKYSDEWSPTTGHSEYTSYSPDTRGSGVTPKQAAIRSALITGWGQWSNGQREKAIGLFIVQLINVLLMGVGIGFLTFPLVWFMGVVDAYEEASQSDE